MEGTKWTQAETFPQLFQGLGKLQGDYKIQLREGTKLYALLIPRCVAIQLVNLVVQELQRMEDLGVIAKVQELTQWCVNGRCSQSDGKVRICMDLTHLNQNVYRERYPLLAVDQTLAHLAVAKLFSKLDANSGFW